ncbi:hypothetical protein Cgig2_004485 [Carnegiea gigantea]|uniref:Uncharacterized protein n=1 Tax=Carnegiea gigantea TaxID=171969 RepID=A0A9Q1JRD2_9CARY|nr:hypothetical protein Cgig2_004485 [Carnegiea gigantea]
MKTANLEGKSMGKQKSSLKRKHINQQQPNRPQMKSPTTAQCIPPSAPVASQPQPAAPHSSPLPNHLFSQPLSSIHHDPEFAQHESQLPKLTEGSSGGIDDSDSDDSLDVDFDAEDVEEASEEEEYPIICKERECPKLGRLLVQFKRGRPSSERRKDITEKRKVYTRSNTLRCSKCKQFGHNYRSHREGNVFEIRRGKDKPRKPKVGDDRRVGRPSKVDENTSKKVKTTQGTSS